jgi:hypothetical protein
MHGHSAEGPPVDHKLSTTFGSTVSVAPPEPKPPVALALCAEPSRIDQGRTQFGQRLTRRSIGTPTSGQDPSFVFAGDGGFWNRQGTVNLTLLLAFSAINDLHGEGVT